MNRHILSGIAAIIFVFGLSVNMNAQVPNTMRDFLTDCEKSNYENTPRFEQTKAYFKKLENASQMVHNTSFGTSPLGRELSLVIVDKDGLTTPEEIRAKGRVIILVQSCIHAGEPDGKDASMIFIRDMVIGKKNIELLDDVSFVFVPVFNVDGHENFTALNRINQNGPRELGTRNTSQQLNLNRDFLKADAPEMKAWLAMYNRWLPELFIDVHVTNGADFQYVMTYAIDNMTDNMEPGITKWSQEIYEKQLCQQMENAGFPIFLYGSFKKYNAPESGFVADTFDPRYSQGYAAAHNRLGLLIENHIYKPYKQRVAATVEAFVASAKILAQNKTSLQTTLAQADAYTSSVASRIEPFGFKYIATDEKPKQANYLSWGRDTVKSDLSGGEWVKHDYNDPITLSIPVYTKYKPAFSIKVPDAYILMPQYKNVIELLDLHGVEYTVLEQAGKAEVETYRYTGGKFSSRQSEGRITVQPEFTTQKETLEYPAGSIYIDMNQPASRVAMWLLEPAAPGSLSYWGFFNVCVQSSNEFWIRPQYMEEKGREMLQKDPQLKAAFEKKLKEDEKFAADPQAILMYFYDIVRKRAHQNNDLHPAWRVVRRDLLDIVTVNDEKGEDCLRRFCTPFKESWLHGKEYKELAERMIRTVSDSTVDGVGLAGPQIGLNKKVVVVQRFDKPGAPFEAYPNITIIEYSKECASGPEGCLSIPGERHNVERSKEITIEYYSVAQKNIVKEKVTGFTAVIFQHEVDHLNGVLYIDRVSK